MPHIIVTADGPPEDGAAPVMLRERVSVSDFESPHFATQLVERLGWAVGDADEINRRPMPQVGRRIAPPVDRRRTPRPVVDASRPELTAVSAPRARPAS